MHSKARYIYWDSCVFLSYINKDPDRIATIDGLWAEISSTPGSVIVSSTLSIVEVAWGAEEGRDSVLSETVIKAIDGMWADQTVKLVEPTTYIMRKARQLMRDAKPQGWSLKPADAIQLATAVWFNSQIKIIDEFHTYDNLRRFSTITGLKICEPYIEQPSLPYPE